MKRLLGIVMAIAAAALFITGLIMLSNERKHAESIYSGATLVMDKSNAELEACQSGNDRPTTFIECGSSIDD